MGVNAAAHPRHQQLPYRRTAVLQVTTEKLDGGNCCIANAPDGSGGGLAVFARTHKHHATHASFGPVKQLAAEQLAGEVPEHIALFGASLDELCCCRRVGLPRTLCLASGMHVLCPLHLCSDFERQRKGSRWDRTWSSQFDKAALSMLVAWRLQPGRCAYRRSALLACSCRREHDSRTLHRVRVRTVVLLPLRRLGQQGPGTTAGEFSG